VNFDENLDVLPENERRGFIRADPRFQDLMRKVGVQ
jgi:hypothetical protein